MNNNYDLFLAGQNTAKATDICLIDMLINLKFNYTFWLFDSSGKEVCVYMSGTVNCLYRRDMRT